MPKPASAANPYTAPSDCTDPRRAIPIPKRAPPRRMRVRGCTYCCSLPATIAATAPMVMSAVNVSETSAADQPKSVAMGLSSTLHA